MGILDEVEKIAAAKSAGGAASTPQVANGLVQAIQQHPGGVGSILSALRENGMSQHVDNWTAGGEQPADPQQVQQALGPSGLIERTAQNAGVSSQVASAAIAALLPMVIQHFAPGGEPAPQSQIGGLASGLLSRLL